MIKEEHFKNFKKIGEEYVKKCLKILQDTEDLEKFKRICFSRRENFPEQSYIIELVKGRKESKKD